MRQLYVKPAEQAFGPKDERKLVRTLEAKFKHLMVDEVESAKSIALDAEGMLPGGFRYTAGAFAQLCGILSPGLYKVIADVAGLTRAPGSEADEYSFTEAVRLYNRMVDLRFSARIDGKLRLLRDLQTRQVEGIVTAAYAHLDNSDLYSRAREAVDGADGRYVFDSATLRGRLFAVRFAEAEPAFSLPLPAGFEHPGVSRDSFRHGLYFVNSEVAGESSVRGAPFLQRCLDATFSLGYCFGDRALSHSGKRFYDNVSRLLGEAASYSPDRAKYKSHVQSLLARPLEVFTEAVERPREANRAIKSRLQEHGLSAEQAGAAIRDVIYRGAYGIGRDVTLDGPSAVAVRTRFDLYSALTTLSREFSATNQERVAHVAHLLLIGRIKLG
jgi:hypothetical protein